MTDLIDTTEMYLRTVYELEEEGIVPMRARIAERLHHSGPTVSQTVGRMQRDGLIVVSDDRHLELTPVGRDAAIRVMRKHRLAECLLVDVIGMPWEQVHDEACRWEHVMSEAVERRVYELLKEPDVSPFGNPIPGLGELVPKAKSLPMDDPSLIALPEIADDTTARVVVRRIAEPIQVDIASMAQLRRVGAVPGATVEVVRRSGVVELSGDGQLAQLGDEIAAHVYVERA